MSRSSSQTTGDKILVKIVLDEYYKIKSILTEIQQDVYDPEPKHATIIFYVKLMPMCSTYRKLEMNTIVI